MGFYREYPIDIKPNLFSQVGGNPGMCISMAWVSGKLSALKGYITQQINWVRRVDTQLFDVYGPDQIPQIGELDELEPFVRSQTKSGCGPSLITSNLEV